MTIDSVNYDVGTAIITPIASVTAGDYASFSIVYTAGYYGMDDTGSLKIAVRFATDMAAPQFDKPSEPNYVSVSASNNAVLECRYDVKDNIRPWDKTIRIKLVRGYLKQGDTITIRFGDQSLGSPGIRMQTFCEDTFEFKILADVFATYNYVELPINPVIKVLPGKPCIWKAVLPSLKKTEDSFELKIKAEDKWGNPADLAGQTIKLESNRTIKGLPDQITIDQHTKHYSIRDLTVNEVSDILISLYDGKNTLLTRSNPLQIREKASTYIYWGDLHGQSEETIGTNSVEDYFTFARDIAFVDVCAHQGNDFQITQQFWSKLQDTTRRFNCEGKFVTFPGYEYSANTALGGDHNIYYYSEGEQIHRSSHALIDDKTDMQTDCPNVTDLFKALSGTKSFVYSHVGGRYADLQFSRECGRTPAVEIHSAWGTFEWLLEDAFKLGLRPGVVANSDDHKGRPGASYPGASMFGSYGGLTCFYASELSRDAIYDCIMKRRHYATTGSRIILHTSCKLDGYPLSFMGEMIKTMATHAELAVSVLAPSPIERIDVLNGLNKVKTIKPCSGVNSRRIRLQWSGAQYRGRGRETAWNGSAKVNGNEILETRAINFWNPERPLQLNRDSIAWQSVTTGGFAGVDLLLKDDKGSIQIDTPLFKDQIKISDIGTDDLVFELGGLDRKLTLFRLPGENDICKYEFTCPVQLNQMADNPLYVRVTTLDGHMAWSSPIYLVRD